MLDTTQRTGRADVHMHTSASDGLASTQQVLDYIQTCAKLDVIAITDHDVLDASLWAYSQREHYNFDIIPGVEVTALEGHILALWVNTPIPKGAVRSGNGSRHPPTGWDSYSGPSGRNNDCWSQSTALLPSPGSVITMGY